MTLRKSFQDEIESFRKEKDQFFSSDEDSPIPAEDRRAFRGLVYYLPDPRFRVRAKLSRFDKPLPVSIATSAGVAQAYLKYGTLTFTLGSANLELVVYKSTEDPYAPSLFVPFSDETSGSDTYTSGRYLDLEESGGDNYELDFNLAY